MSPAVDFTHANAAYLPAGYPCPQLFRRVYLGAYYPAFRSRVLAARAAAFARGQEYVSEFGYRAMSLQATLRAKYLAGTGGRAAPAGLSAHQYGIADDVTADADMQAPGLQPTWEPARYAIHGEETERQGLVWGKSFGDLPHSNLAGFTNGAELTPLLLCWNRCPASMPEDQRLLAVWALLDTLRARA